MTTATAKLNTALITMASQGSRPRCADPIDHQPWTSEDESDRDIAAQWCSGCEVPLPITRRGHLTSVSGVLTSSPVESGRG
jgi:hypothetical protein